MERNETFLSFVLFFLDCFFDLIFYWNLTSQVDEHATCALTSNYCSQKFSSFPALGLHPLVVACTANHSTWTHLSDCVND